MDFHSLKRKELQALCKKHKIPANLTNLEMANELTALLMGNEKPLTQGRKSCLKGLEENACENESDVENRPAKKVRFSPRNEMIEFEKSEIKDTEKRGRRRRKFVMNNKGCGVVGNGSDAQVDEGVGRVTRSRKGKLIEGSEVESKGGGERGTKDNALKDKLPSAGGDVENGSDAEVDKGLGRVIRSRRGKLIEGSEHESKGGWKRGTKDNALKDKLPSASCVAENGSDTEVDGGFGRVTRSRRGKLIEGSEVENNGRGKGRTKDNALKDKLPSDCGVLEDVSHAVMDEGAGRVTRTRKVKLIEGSEIKSNGGKRGIKGDDWKAAASDNVPLVDATHEEHLVVGKRSLRRRVMDVGKKENHFVEKASRRNEVRVVPRKRSLRNIELKDEEKMENEDVKKGSRKNGSHREDKHRKDIAGTKETEEESVGIEAEKVLRGSRRHVADVANHKLVNEEVTKNEKVGQGRSRSMTAGKIVKEGSPADNNMRRSKRNAPKPESLIPMEQIDEVANSNDKRETKRGRRIAILQEQAVKVDADSVERPLRRSTRNTERSGSVAPTIVRGKVAQKEKGRSKKTKVKAEDSFGEKILTSENLPASEAELMMPEVAKDTVVDNFNDTVAGCVSDYGSADACQSNFLRKDQESVSVSDTFVKNADSPFTDAGVQKKDPSTNGKSLHPPSDDNDVQMDEDETYSDEKRKGGNESEQVLYMRKTPLTVKANSLARQHVGSDVIDELNQLGGFTGRMILDTYSVSVREFTKEQKMHEIIAESGQYNLEESNSRDHKNSHPSNAICEVATADTVNCCSMDAALTPLNNADENEKDEHTDTLNSTETLKQREESMPLQRNSCEAHNVCAADTYFNHHELTFSVDAKSEEDGHLKVEYETSDDHCQPSASDAFRSATEELQDGNVGCGLDINQPVDLQGRVLVATPLSAKAVETVTELSESACSSRIVEPLKCNFTVKLSDDLDCKVAGESLDTMDLKTQSELRTQSPSEPGKAVEAKLFEDGHNLIEASNCEEVGHLKHHDDALDYSWQSHELKSSSKVQFSGLKDQGVTKSQDSISISNAQGVTLLLHSESTQIAKGAKCTEIELSGSKSSSMSTAPENSSLMLKFQASGTNTESEHCPLTDYNADYQGYGAGSEVERKEKSVPTQELCMMKMPSTSEDAGLERCNMSTDGSLNGVIDVLNDQLGPIEEGMEHGGNIESGGEAAMESPYKSYIGEDGRPINLEKSNCKEFGSHLNLIAVSEVAATAIVDGCIPVVVHTPLKNAAENPHGENTSIMHSRRTLKQREESTAVQRNGCEAHNPSASCTTFDHLELNASAKNQEPVPDVSRRSTRKIQHDGNAHDGEIFVQPSNLQGTVLTSTQISTTVEPVTQFSESTSYLNRVESPKAYFNFEFLDFRQDSGFTNNSKGSPLPHNSLQKQGASTDNVCSDKQSELRTQSPSKQRMGVDRDFVVEAYTALEGEQNHVEVANFEKVGYLKDQDTASDDWLQYDELDFSTRSKFSFIHDQGVPSAEDTVVIASSDLGAEAYIASEDGQTCVEVYRFEGDGHLKDKGTVLDDLLQNAELDCYARSNFSFIQDQGVSGAEDTVETTDSNLSPPSFATHIIEGRCREIELSARKCSSTSKTPTNSHFISECQVIDTNTEIVQCHLTDENVPNKGYGDCCEGETNEGSKHTQALHMVQMPSTSKDDDIEGSGMCMNGSLCGIIDDLNAELGSITEGMKPKENCISGSEPDIGKEMQESCIGEEDGPFNMEATNTNESETIHSLDAALEVATIGTLEGCPSHAAQTPLKSSNGEQGVKLVMLLTEPVCVSSTREEKNALSRENEIEHDIMSSKKVNNLGKDELSCQSDKEFSREEQEQDTASYKDSMNAATAAEIEIQRINQHNFLPDVADWTNDGWSSSNSWHGDELKMLFSNSVTGREDNIIQKRDNGAFSISNFDVPSPENRDCLVLSNGTQPQLDEQKIVDSEIQKEIEVGEEIDDEHLDSGVEVHMFSSLETHVSLGESKGEDSFLFDQTKDAEDETGTSVALVFGKQLTMPGINAEEKVADSDIQDPAVSESSIFMSHELLRERDVDTMTDCTDSKSKENLSSSTNNPSNSSGNDVLLEVELTPLVEPEAESVEENIDAGSRCVEEIIDAVSGSVEKTVDAASQNNKPLAEKQELGEAREETNHQCFQNAGGGVVLEGNWILHSETNSSLSKNLNAVAGGSIKSPAKQPMSIVNKKSARTILIHGTPHKLQMTVDMKENAPNSKLENVVSLTTVRPATKRRALKDLLHK